MCDPLLSWYPRLLWTLASSRVAAAQTSSTRAPALPPVQRLGAPIATSSRDLGTIASVRSLPGGRLLINDASHRRVLLADSTLGVLSVLVDTAQAATTQYGTRPGGLVPFLADSTLFVDIASPAMYVIDPTGRVARTLSVPVPREAPALAAARLGVPGVDAHGALVYHGTAPRPANPRPKPGDHAAFAYPDTSMIVRVDFATRTPATIAWYKDVALEGLSVGQPDGTTMSFLRENPLPVVDSWGVLADGSVAILRGRDFHIDFIGADGATRSLLR